jgi:hypothetical protein
MPLQPKKHRQNRIAIPEKNAANKSKKWQNMFRYIEEREKAIKELVVFACLVHELSEQSINSPDWIRDGDGGKIYL